MPNGEYNQKWVQEKFENIDCRINKVWGEHGFLAVWKRMDSMEKKLWLIIIALIGNMGGIIVVLLKMSIQ